MARPGVMDVPHYDARKDSLVIYSYWTNFNSRRALTGDYEVLVYDPELGYWQFKTNIDPKRLEGWDKKHRNRFLFQMEEFYNRAKT